MDKTIQCHICGYMFGVQLDISHSSCPRCLNQVNCTIHTMASELKILEKMIDTAVEENFGTCPNEPWITEAIEKRDELIKILDLIERLDK